MICEGNRIVSLRLRQQDWTTETAKIAQSFRCGNNSAKKIITQRLSIRINKPNQFARRSGDA